MGGGDYISWEEIPGHRHDAEDREAAIEDLQIDFLAEESLERRREQETSRSIHALQLEVEKELQQRGNIFVYGILEGKIFPAVVSPEGDKDAYASEEWLQMAENMISIETAISYSEKEEQLGETLKDMRYELPKGLENRAYRLIENAGAQPDELHEEVEGTYVLPMLSDEEYEQL